jgi:hypothetical protein
MLMLKPALVDFGIILLYLPNSVVILSKLEYFMCLVFLKYIIWNLMIFKQAICVADLMIYYYVAT